MLNFQAQKGWICPIEWDTRNHGNKFYNIESTLDPLFKNGGIMFNDKMKNTPMGEITVQQFLEERESVEERRHTGCSSQRSFVNGEESEDS